VRRTLHQDITLICEWFSKELLGVESMCVLFRDPYGIAEVTATTSKNLLEIGMFVHSQLLASSRTSFKLFHCFTISEEIHLCLTSLSSTTWQVRICGLLHMDRAREVRVLDMQRKLADIEASRQAAEERAAEAQRSMAAMQERVTTLEKQMALAG
jgi:hypothetical protein